MLEIEINTIDAGWIHGVIRKDELHYYFGYSWISNVMNDIMKGLLIVGGYFEDHHLNHDQFTAYCEPAIDDWKFSKNDNDLVITIHSYEDESRLGLIEKVELKCDYDEFVKAFIAGVTAIIKKIGLYGYRMEWEEEFPLSLFLKLNDICQNTTMICTKELTLDDTYGRGGHASNINAELEIMKEIFTRKEIGKGNEKEGNCHNR